MKKIFSMILPITIESVLQMIVGFVSMPMIVAGIGIWGVRIPFSLFFTYYFHMNIIAIWLVMGADIIVRFFLSFTLYKTKAIFERDILLEESI